MTLLVFFLLLLIGVHLLGSIVATNVITARISEENPPEGMFAAVSGGRLHLHDIGRPEDGKLPIVLLHGATSNAGDMRLALAGELARTYRVIAIDRPGHGWSSRPGRRRDASPAQQARLIVAALQQRGIERFVVVGHSLAASVATNLALDHKDKVAGLVVLSGATHPWPGGINWYYRLAAMPVLGRLFVHTVMTPAGSWGLQKSAEDSFAPHSAPADYVRKTQAALVLRPAEFRWNAQDVADLKAFLAHQAPRYGEIAVPTAIIADPDDKVVYTSVHAEPLSRQVPGSKLTLIRGAGHQIHYTARDAVLAEIERVAMQSSFFCSGQETRTASDDAGLIK